MTVRKNPAKTQPVIEIKAGKAAPAKKAAPGTKEVNWIKVEAEYRAAIRTLDDIGQEFGISKGRISQKAKELGWTRNLAASIALKAEAKIQRVQAKEELNAQALNDPTKRAEKRLAEEEVVDLNAAAHVRVITGHKRGLSRISVLRDNLMSELETVTDNLGLFEELGELLDMTDVDSKGNLRVDKQNLIYRKVISMPERVEALKKLTEIDEKVRKGEREAFNIGAEGEKKTGIEEHLDAVKKKLGIA